MLIIILGLRGLFPPYRHGEVAALIWEVCKLSGVFSTRSPPPPVLIRNAASPFHYQSMLQKKEKYRLSCL